MKHDGLLVSSLNVILISEKKISTEQEVGDNWFRLDKVEEMKWNEMKKDASRLTSWKGYIEQCINYVLSLEQNNTHQNNLHAFNNIHPQFYISPKSASQNTIYHVIKSLPIRFIN